MMPEMHSPHLCSFRHILPPADWLWSYWLSHNESCDTLDFGVFLLLPMNWRYGPDDPLVSSLLVAAFCSSLHYSLSSHFPFTLQSRRSTDFAVSLSSLQWILTHAVVFRGEVLMSTINSQMKNSKREKSKGSKMLIVGESRWRVYKYAL